MSSPKAAVKTARRAKTAAKLAAKPPAPRPAAKRPIVPQSGQEASEASPALSADARRLAEEIERALAQGRADALSPDAFQALMAALVRTYAVQAETGDNMLPLQGRGHVANTDIMLMASALLRSANLAVFELGMWQSWTGR
jgi:hypothetical protein